MGVQAQRASEVQMNLAHNVLVIGLLSLRIPTMPPTHSEMIAPIIPR